MPMSFTEKQDRLHRTSQLVSVEHMNNLGRQPIATRYTIRNRFKPGVRWMVVRSNDWWQVQSHRAPSMGTVTAQSKEK
jgi:hypothetical protein